VAAVGVVISQLLIPRSTVVVPDVGGTYIEGVAGAPQYINPLLCQLHDEDRDLCSLVFVGLTRFNETGEVVPELASGWEISPDGITYTFKLRQDARWQDGQPVTADDVLFTTRLLQNPDFPGRPDIGALWQSVTVVKLDRYTVQFQLTQPLAPFLDFTTIGLLPEHVLSGTLAANLDQLPFNLQPVGNGPWRVAEVNTSNNRVASIALEPNSNYYGPKPTLSRLVFRYYPNIQAVFEAFRTGDIDGMGNLPPALAKRAEAIPDLTLYSATKSRYVALFVNLRPDSGAIALSDKAVRLALMHALDRRQIIREALDGQGIVAHTPFIPGTWAFDAGVTQYPFDPDRAVQYLKTAGYELATVAPSNISVWQKNGEPIAFTLLTQDDPTRRAVAEAVARQWRTLGVQVSVQPVRNLVRDFLATRQFQVALVETLLDGDPDPYPLWHRSQIVQPGQNYTGFDNADASDWLEKARLTTDRATRFEYYRRFQALFAEELPALPLYYPTYQYAISTRVKRVQIPPLVYPSDRLRTIGEWYVNVKRILASEATAQPN
ncbi:MAG: peptide ABC transporter substrate-binding protein, partial [Anaerolineae bacterium]|nr:peptide ABC transporter substrate-binding protein [Thermoflexales bacterium]MDW8406413.1 peptide ABC transporter substrate-binding protein [Anaerolineae bacterium]